MVDKLSKSEFKKSLKEYAAQFKLQIESMNDGFDISPAACQARRKYPAKGRRENGENARR